MWVLLCWQLRVYYLARQTYSERLAWEKPPRGGVLILGLNDETVFTIIRFWGGAAGGSSEGRRGG